MSTRCQVQIVGIGINPDKFTLYHHTDGYPTYMLPLMAKAEGDSWEYGRAGKVASFLCAADPGVFEPEQGHELHDDVEYYYRITVGNDPWIVEVYEGYGLNALENCIAGPLALKLAAQQAETIEEQSNNESA